MSEFYTAIICVNDQCYKFKVSGNITLMLEDPVLGEAILMTLKHFNQHTSVLSPVIDLYVLNDDELVYIHENIHRDELTQPKKVKK